MLYHNKKRMLQQLKGLSTRYTMPKQLDIFGWNGPTITYLLCNTQTARYIAVKQSNNYLLVIQCSASWVYCSETDQWLSTCYTMAQPSGYIGVKQTTIIYLLYNVQPPGYIGAKQTNDYLLVIQSPAKVKQPNNFIYSCYTMPSQLDILGWNRPMIRYTILCQLDI